MPSIAINGFGRIGRNVFKAGFTKPGFNVVAINDLTDTKTLAHLLKHDTVYRHFAADIKAEEKALIINGQKIQVFAEKDPTQLPWKKLGIDIVLECTGRFTDFESASQHMKAGAKRVILSAPAKDPQLVPTHVMGVNEKQAGKSKCSDCQRLSRHSW
jgi:glyceraldehyde 3-phosphate dehydrogenase